jgi:hypothetical protein
MAAESCTICLESLSPSKNDVVIPCGHTYHSKCLTGWFQIQSTRTCPLCRKDVPTDVEKEAVRDTPIPRVYVPRTILDAVASCQGVISPLDDAILQEFVCDHSPSHFSLTRPNYDFILTSAGGSALEDYQWNVLVTMFPSR